jgi:integrase
MGRPFCRKNEKGKARWYIYVVYKGQRTRRVAGKTRAEALRYQRNLEMRLERDKGASIRDKKIPFAFLCDEYLKWAGNNLGKQTLKERTMIVRVHLKPFFRCLSGDIGVKEIEAYKTKRKQMAPATINKELKVISCVLKFGIEFGYLVDLPRIRRLKDPKKQPRFLTSDEIGTVLTAAHPKVRPMLQLLIFSGIRKGEMAHLEWEDIDFRNRLIQIRPKKDWSPKSGRPRSIPMNQPALEALLDAKKAHSRGGSTSTLVFPGRIGYIGDIRDGLNNACARAGVPRVTIHQLRHTCASQMVMAGADLASVASALGHKDITTTMIYAHLTQEHVRAQMEKLNVIPIPKICPKSAPNNNSERIKRERGTRKKSDSPVVSIWCRRGDSNPHGFPHHPLKMACLPCSTTSARKEKI